MDIIKLLDELEELLESSSRIPMTGKVILDAESVFDYIDRIRAVLPEEIRQAKFVSEEREKMLQEGQRQAEKLFEEARNHAEKMLADNEMVKQAQIQAENMVLQAEKVSLEIKDSAKIYANDVLHQMEFNLEKVLSMIKKGREELQNKQQ